MSIFNDKTVFITGGSSGIGLSAAHRLAEKGAHVVIFSRGEDRLEQAGKEIAACGISAGQRFGGMPLDVADRDAAENVLKRAVEEFGAPDILINSAGRACPHYVEDVTHEQFDETMKINLYGVWNTVSILLPHMKEKGGHIANVSSIAGFLGVFGYTDYCASKFAVIGFSEALKSEVKRYNIGVSVLCPPDTDTPGLEAEDETKPPETRAIAANAKLMQPGAVADALLRGIEKNRFMIIPGVDGKMTWTAKRLFPGLVSFVMDRTINKVRKNRDKQTKD